MDGTTQAGRGRRRHAIDSLLPYREHRARRAPTRTTTWWALAMYVVVLTMGSAILGLMLGIFMQRAGPTDGYPLATLASIIPALAALLLVLLQTWDVAQVLRYRQPMQVVPPLRHGLSDRTWAIITPLLLGAGFVLGKFFWG